MRKVLVGILVLTSIGFAGESVELDFGKAWEKDISELPPRLMIKFDYAENKKGFIKVK